jgi:autotransporter-associated beta strand protein
METGSSLSLTNSTDTATFTSGGILVNATSGASISGGNITSGVSGLYVHANGGPLTISSAIVDGASSVSLVKAGSNTLTINGTNTYTGGTYVNSGTLAMTGGSLANGNVFVRGAATFSMNSTSAVSFNLNGTNAGQFDVFTQDAGGIFTLNGTMNLKFSGTFTNGASFDLFNLASGTADGFTAISITGSYVGSLTESTSGIWTGTVGGQDFTFTEASGVLNVASSAIPEPSTYAFFAGVLSVGLAAVLRRRRVA